ncbi:hypothetical protein JCM10213_007492 [Rhodosporidiobolus nylandii]
MSSPRPRPLLPQLKRTRSLSASSASPAPLSPAFRVVEQYLSITDDMAAFTLDKEQRTSALVQAQTQAEKLAAQLSVLREQVTSAPNDLALWMKLLEVEGDLKRALKREKVAKQALASPTIAGPPAPKLQDLNSPTHIPPLFPPSPPRTPWPVQPIPSSRSQHRPPSPATTRPRISISPSRSPAFTPFAASLRLTSPLLPSTPIPRSDPLPHLGNKLPSRSGSITLHLTVPHHTITRKLGPVQAVAPSSTDLGGLKERLRVEGERRGAHAVVGMATRVWGGEGGGLVGVGRAVRLRRA